MLDALAALPFWQAFVALWVIVMARSNATYWLHPEEVREQD